MVRYRKGGREGGGESLRDLREVRRDSLHSDGKEDGG